MVCLCSYTTITKYNDSCGKLVALTQSTPQTYECSNSVRSGTNIITYNNVTVSSGKKCNSIEPSNPGA